MVNVKISFVLIALFATIQVVNQLSSMQKESNNLTAEPSSATVGSNLIFLRPEDSSKSYVLNLDDIEALSVQSWRELLDEVGKVRIAIVETGEPVPHFYLSSELDEWLIHKAIDPMNRKPIIKRMNVIVQGSEIVTVADLVKGIEDLVPDTIDKALEYTKEETDLVGARRDLEKIAHNQDLDLGLRNQAKLYLAYMYIFGLGGGQAIERASKLLEEISIDTPFYSKASALLFTLTNTNETIERIIGLLFKYARPDQIINWRTLSLVLAAMKYLPLTDHQRAALYWIRGKIFVLKEKYEQAKDQLSSAIVLGDSQTRAQVLYDLGKLYLIPNLKNVEFARQYFETIIREELNIGIIQRNLVQEAKNELNKLGPRDEKMRQQLESKIENLESYWIPKLERAHGMMHGINLIKPLVIATIDQNLDPKIKAKGLYFLGKFQRSGRLDSSLDDKFSIKRDFIEAKETLEQALSLAQKLDDQNLILDIQRELEPIVGAIALNLYHLGRSKFDLYDKEGAQKDFYEAIELAQQMGDEELQRKINKKLQQLAK